MRKNLLTILASLLLVLSFSTTSNAASFNIGVTGSIADIHTTGNEVENSDTDDTSTTEASVENASVPVGAVFVEYESDFWGLTLGLSHVPMSADVSKNVKERNDTETSVTSDNTGNSDARTFKAQAEVENFNNIYIELPLINNFFVRAGLAEIDVNTLEVASSNGGNYGNTSLDGTLWGVGLKGDVGSNMGYKLFYEKTDFDTLKLTSTGNSVASETNSLTADMDISELKFALSYKF